MTDIVERLRERTENIDAIFEAADEIETLRAEIDRLRSILKAAHASTDPKFIIERAMREGEGNE